MTSTPITFDMRRGADHHSELVTLSIPPAEVIAQEDTARPASIDRLNEWNEQGFYTFDQVQDALSRLSMQDRSPNLLIQRPQLSTDTYAELDTRYLQIPNIPPVYQLPQFNTSTEPQEGDCSSSDDHIIALETRQQRSLHRLQAHQASVDYTLETAEHWQESAKSQQELVELEKAYLQQLALELEDAGHGRQHKSQGGNYDRKNNSHDNSSSGTGQGRQEQPNDTKVPDFMKEYLPGRPDAGEPPTGDEPGVKRCSVGRPVGTKLEKGTVCYQVGRCDKHLRKSVFDDNMKMQIESQKSYRLIEHAWKCSDQATLRPRTPAPGVSD